MLPSRLLDLRRTPDGAIAPRWLGSSDEPWLCELVAEARASDGRRADEADARVLEIVAPTARRHGVSRRSVEAVWHVERARWTSRIDSPVAPERIRRVLFDLAAERSREEALATAAAELGISEDTIVASLFADRAKARRLVAPSEAVEASDLSRAYNLALVQSLLCRSTAVTAIVRAEVRSVVRHAKLLRLMTAFDEEPDGALRVVVSGPLALFHDTVKYGRALAAWFPSIVSTPGWSLEARVVIGGETLNFNLDASAPVPRTFALPRAHDSKVEARLEKDVRALASEWRIEREAGVLRAGGRLFFPDFRLVSEGGSVLVEIVGFWTREYLTSKLAMLRAASVPLVVCVDERHEDAALAADDRVIFFRRGGIDAAALLAACGRAIAGGDPRGASETAPVAATGTLVPEADARRYRAVIPESSLMRAHAIRAGATPGRWREDVVEDIGACGMLRVVRLPNRAGYGPQLRIVGRRFSVEVNPDRLRRDALFVHRVMPSSPNDVDQAETREAVLELAAPGEAAPPSNDVRILFS